MTLISRLDQRLRALDDASLTRRRRIVDTPCAPRLLLEGRPLLAFCSNDYLGLAAHPAVIDALREGAALYGAGSGASHLISGHSRAHQQLEERLAATQAASIPHARALSFATGYMANLAILTALGGEDDATLFCESLNHASLIDGARLARASVQVYPHADVAALAALLEASTANTKIVVTDSVFSMDGELAPLAALLALCERHGAWLVVDDAHGFGALGEHGHGALAQAGLVSTNLIYMGTLGKAAGVAGAFVAAHASVIAYLMQRARPYIYTTAAPPALAHALLTSLDIIEGDEGASRRAHLDGLIARFRCAVQVAPWTLGASASAIQPLIIGDNAAALRAAAALYQRGLWVPAIRPPTVAAGTARLRVTLSAAHTVDDVAQLVAALNTLERH
ncbi:8-amino-7-oxononanoate synthase [Massilia sp. PWRC2]|uniref:8-amino-7-oxononanoate synthase n=1 Tax=Massilia sp. PWRC2 TaxID=2804626 RepID=UPI003CF9C0EB